MEAETGIDVAVGSEIWILSWGGRDSTASSRRRRVLFARHSERLRFCFLPKLTRVCIVRNTELESCLVPNP